MSRYLDLVRAPGVAPLVVASAIGRLPYGMNILALILLLRAEGLSYAEVGIVSAASGLALGATAPLVGRLIDRAGQTRVLVGTTCVCVAAETGLVVAAVSGAGVAVLTGLAVVGGASTPPISPAMRTLWPELVGRERLDTAFAFDALQLEVFFITGPLLAAGIAAWISPAAALLCAVAMQAAGALGFASAPASRAWRPATVARERRAGALSSRGMRVVVLTLTLLAVSVGVLEIGIPAFAEQDGSRDDSGWLFALWALGSLTGGIWYGARSWRLQVARRFLILAAVLTAGLAPLAFAGSPAAFGLFLVAAGLGLAPFTAAAYSLIGQLAPEGATTEAYAWQIVAAVAGGAVGAGIAGLIIEEFSVQAALACAPLAAGAGLVAAVAGRRALVA